MNTSGLDDRGSIPASPPLVLTVKEKPDRESVLSYIFGKNLKSHVATSLRQLGIALCNDIYMEFIVNIRFFSVMEF